MLQSCAARPGPAWSGVGWRVAGPVPETSAAAGPGAPGHGVAGPIPRSRADWHYPARPSRSGSVPPGPAGSLCPLGEASSPATARPALPAQSRVGRRPLNLPERKMSLSEHILWRLHWQIAQKAKNIPGVHGSGRPAAAPARKSSYFWCPPSEVTTSPRAALGSAHFSTSGFPAPS